MPRIPANVNSGSLKPPGRRAPLCGMAERASASRKKQSWGWYERENGKFFIRIQAMKKSLRGHKHDIFRFFVPFAASQSMPPVLYPDFRTFLSGGDDPFGNSRKSKSHPPPPQKSNRQIRAQKNARKRRAREGGKIQAAISGCRRDFQILERAISANPASENFSKISFANPPTRRDWASRSSSPLAFM